jgi:pyruvate kinase
MMEKIAFEAEKGLSYGNEPADERGKAVPAVDDAAARAACQIAHQIDARAIVAFTAGGSTALRVSRYRPYQPIIAVTPSEVVARRLSLSWGVVPVTMPAPESIEEVFSLAGRAAVESGAARQNDVVVITAGLPLSVSGSTNLVKIHTIGKEVYHG